MSISLPRGYKTDKPEFEKAHVRIYGAFDEETRRKIANHHDIWGNLVVTITDTEISVAFDQSDHVYVVTIRRED